MAKTIEIYKTIQGHDIEVVMDGSSVATLGTGSTHVNQNFATIADLFEKSKIKGIGVVVGNGVTIDLRYPVVHTQTTVNITSFTFNYTVVGVRCVLVFENTGSTDINVNLASGTKVFYTTTSGSVSVTIPEAEDVVIPASGFAKFELVLL